MKYGGYALLLSTFLYTARYNSANENSFFSGNVIGRISYAKGEVDIISLKDRSRRPAKIGTPVYDYDQVRTGTKSRILLSLVDSSRLEILPSTVANIVQTGKASADMDSSQLPITVRVLSGKIRLKVTSSAIYDKKVYIKTPTILAMTSEADLGCIATLSDARCIVFEGSMKIANRSPSLRKSYVLRDRQEVRVIPEYDPTEMKFVDKSLLDSYIESFEITRKQEIKKKIREPNTAIDRIFLKVE